VSYVSDPLQSYPKGNKNCDVLLFSLEAYGPLRFQNPIPSMGRNTSFRALSPLVLISSPTLDFAPHHSHCAPRRLSHDRSHSVSRTHRHGHARFSGDRPV